MRATYAIFPVAMLAISSFMIEPTLHAHGGDRAMCIVFGAVFAAAGVIGAGSYLPRTRGLVLTDSEIQIPRFLGHTSIPLADVTGVGLLYFDQPPPGDQSGANQRGWQLALWDKENQRIVVSDMLIPGAPIWVPLHPSTPPAPVVAPTDPSEIAQSTPGRAASAIYRAATGIQGPTGHLASQHLQTTERYRRSTSPRSARTGHQTANSSGSTPPAPSPRCRHRIDKDSSRAA